MTDAAPQTPHETRPLDTHDDDAARDQWWDVWDQFKTHKGAVMGATFFIFVILAVYLGPFLWTIDPTYIDVRARNEGPSLLHPFGTDQLGRDMMARMMAGGQTSISVGLTAMGLALFLGTLVGVLAGYFKRIDGLLMRITDLFLALPLLPLLLVMVMLFRQPLSSSFGPETGIFILIVTAIGITSWMPTARIVRGDVLALKYLESVLAARAIGTPPGQTTLPSLLPTLRPPHMLSPPLLFPTLLSPQSFPRPPGR